MDMAVRFKNYCHVAGKLSMHEALEVFENEIAGSTSLDTNGIFSGDDTETGVMIGFKDDSVVIIAKSKTYNRYNAMVLTAEYITENDDVVDDLIERVKRCNN